MDSVQKSPAGRNAGAWLLAALRRLSPENPELISYLMILVALVPFVLLPPASLAAWEFYGTIAALSLMLVLTAMGERIAALVGNETRFNWLMLVVFTVLFLVAFALGATGFASFIPFLGFMLVGQATFNFALRPALLYALVLLLAVGAIAWFGGGAQTAALTLTSMLPGIFFTMVFTLLARRAGEQTRRVEGLLADLRQANAELVAAREREQELAVAEERVRLARDIHDGLGHHLTVLNIQLQAAEKLATRDPARAGQAVSTARQVAQAALKEVRQSVAALRQTPLDGRTLDQALTSLVTEFDQASPLEARLVLSGTPRPLPPAVALTLYRAAQEGLTNAQKHVGSGIVTVAVAYAGPEVQLRVADTGAGDPVANEESGGFGLIGLRERAVQLGGAFHAAPTPQGFVLELALPVEEQP